MATVVEPTILEDALSGLDGWTGDNTRISRRVDLTDEQHERVRARVMATAEAMNHHPDIERDGDTTTFNLTTRSEGGVTELDINFASEIDIAVRQETGTPLPKLPEHVRTSHSVSSARDEGHPGPSATSSSEGRPAGEFMGVPSGTGGGVQEGGVALPDTAPYEPEPGEPDEQEPPYRPS